MLGIATTVYAEELYHPADTNQDWKLTSQEFEAYNTAWRKKQSWPAGPVPIQMDDVTRAGYLVSHGEDYIFVESETGTLRWKSKTFTNSIGMTFNYIAPGTFQMGSPSDEPGRESDEDQHEVTLTKGYFMQTTEITQGQWKAVMGSNPASFYTCGDNCPVEKISWNDVQEFIAALNQQEGTSKYRLPTEAEWEYAARAGSGLAFANGEINETGCGNDPNLTQIGWYCGNANDKTHPVAQKISNAWGLYDMHGNVWEWCQDWYDADYPSGPVTDPIGPGSGSCRVDRGGSWSNNARRCRSANRDRYSPGDRFNYVGARLAFFGPVQ